MVIELQPYFKNCANSTEKQMTKDVIIHEFNES